VASLGAISTILASYLAKVRGSGEPEFSTIHARELNTFLRDIEAFIMDHGLCLVCFIYFSFSSLCACCLLDSFLWHCVCMCRS